MRKLLIRGVLLFFFAGLLVLTGVTLYVNHISGARILFVSGIIGEVLAVLYTFIAALRYRRNKQSKQ